MKLGVFLVLYAWLPFLSHAASVTESSLTIDFLTLFTNADTPVYIELEWDFPDDYEGSSDVLTYTINGDGMGKNKSFALDSATNLPTTLESSFLTKSGGTTDIVVTIELNGEVVGEASASYQAYGEGASLVPLIMILILGFTTQIVELSLGLGIFIGACMIAGNVQGGYIATLENYILGAVADGGHAYVYMFTAFLGGFVGLVERGGGFGGFAETVAVFAQTPSTGHFIAFLSGGIIFFDDYANCLVVGASLRSTLDNLGVSREKLAFIVDATAAPVASLVPLSSWIGFEISLIQEELDKIDDAESTVGTSGFVVFLESLKYRYYSIFMLIFIFFMIAFNRDFGPMLVAERKTIIYGRKDGGDGKGHSTSLQEMTAPDEDTPKKIHNFFVPVFFLIFFIFYILVDSGDDGSGEQSIMDKIESSDSYVALLYGTMAASLLTALFYMIQFKKDGKLITPTLDSMKYLVRQHPMQTAANDASENMELPPLPLISVKEALEVFIYGHIKIFRTLIVLTLAWASGAIMMDVGADRLFERWIVDSGMDPGSLPTLSYLIAMLISLSTGTSWGTMGILFPLITRPTYIAADGDQVIFYATISGILAGAITGDHASPISDTTILSCVACDCGIFEHVKTQFPYVMTVAFWSVIFGTLPVGFSSSFPNFVAILLGIVGILASIMLLGASVVAKDGKFDIGTEIYMKLIHRPDLEKIKQDTITFAKNRKEENENAIKKLTDSEDEEEPEVVKADILPAASVPIEP